MYAAHFQLREMPFSITPDPAYLYMSPRHQEALGHLLYGTGQYGGFVQLTGEVGTGKTTVVRTLLAQKLADVDVAVILNPRQNEQEFVASICDELHVTYPAGATLKQLVDALNAHLLAAHADKRRTVVIIDEAQNLAPAVLEQVRLLTNLETHKEKLLRIMLVGQPELAELLARQDLRQLAQRITARYHLTPLSEAEAQEYIAHRLRVAGGDAEIFRPEAVQLIHRLARGIPRLINVICDRALLGAYGRGVKHVNPEIAQQAAQEAIGGALPPLPRAPLAGLSGVSSLSDLPPWAWAAGGAVAATLIALLFFVAAGFRQAPREAAAAAPRETAMAAATPREAPSSATPAAPAPAGMAAVTVAPGTAPSGIAPSVPAAPAGDAAPQSRVAALFRNAEPLNAVMTRLIGLWRAGLALPAGQRLCPALSAQGLECYKARGEWSNVGALNRPAVLTLATPRGTTIHVLLRELGTQHALLETVNGPVRLPLTELDALWTGEYLLLWPRESDNPLIGPGAAGEPVRWLRRKLALAEGAPAPADPSPQYDAELRAQVQRFQRARGLDPDGIAGILTQIMLGHLGAPAESPVLTPAGDI